MSELDLATWRTLVALASVGLVMVGAETWQGDSREENGKIEIGDSIENFFPYNKIYAFGVQFWHA